jgi:polyisoprenyl-phosphate glycosyltransferase
MNAMHNSNIELSIVVPIHNEESNIDYFMKQLLHSIERITQNYEIICVNDGSTDNTMIKLINNHYNNSRIKILNFSRNFGKEIALTAGLRYSQGEAVIPMDADLQHPPEMIEVMVAKWREGYDVVYAVKSKRHGENWSKRLSANLFYRFINLFSDIPIPHNTSDFRLLDRRVVTVLNQIPERTRFMKGLFAWVGFKQVGIPYDSPPRHLGKTKMNLWKLWNFALDGITLFSTAGLKFWSYVGIVISMLSFLYAIYLVIRTLFLGKDLPGYASIMVTILFLGGLQLFSLGILGEYLGRVYAEVKQRPLFVLRDKYGFEDEEYN